MASCGKMCEPLEKRARRCGRERGDGAERRMGSVEYERERMAPEVRSEVVMERSAVSCWVEIGWVIVGR